MRAGASRRPLAVVRCPEGIAGEQFFRSMARCVVRGNSHRRGAGQPYLAIDGADGLIAMAQCRDELHAWGAAEADPLHPD